jgi:hypothetical protein
MTLMVVELYTWFLVALVNVTPLFTRTLFFFSQREIRYEPLMLISSALAPGGYSTRAKGPRIPVKASSN